MIKNKPLLVQILNANPNDELSFLEFLFICLIC